MASHRHTLRELTGQVESAPRKTRAKFYSIPITLSNNKILCHPPCGTHAKFVKRSAQWSAADQITEGFLLLGRTRPLSTDEQR
jgi:hypothetical protein